MFFKNEKILYFLLYYKIGFIDNFMINYYYYNLLNTIER